MSRFIQAEQLQRFASDFFRSRGSNQDEATAVAEHMLASNLRGHDSHGIHLIEFYQECLASEALKPNAPLESVKDDGSVLVFDGNNGYGQRMARDAVQAGIERASNSGVAIVGLRNSHHVGRVGTYCEQAAAAGLVSMVFVNSLEFPPRVAPLGGREGKLMTNPIAFGAPRQGREPIIMDIATSAVAFGKVEVARNRGDALPPNSIIDGDGRPSIDPNDLYADGTGTKKAGAILPFGGHKGYGLMLFCDILAGALVGGDTARSIGEHTLGCTNNMLAIIIDPDSLSTRGFAAELEQYLEFIVSSEPVDPDFPVILPGDIELKTLARRQEEGIPIDDATWATLVTAAQSEGLVINDYFSIDDTDHDQG